MENLIIEALYLCDKEKNIRCNPYKECENKNCHECKLTKYPEYAKHSEAVEAYNNFLKHFTLRTTKVTDLHTVVSCIEKEDK